MLKQNSELRAEARAALTDKWVMAAIATLIYSAVVGGLSAILVVGILILLLTLPIAYGYAIVILDVFRGSDVNIGGLFDGFSDYGRIIGTKLLQAIYTVLWTLLLVIPGIIKYYSYAMTDFILKDQPELANNGAIEKSMAMMEGNKMKLSCSILALSAGPSCVFSHWVSDTSFCSLTCRQLMLLSMKI